MGSAPSNTLEAMPPGCLLFAALKLPDEVGMSSFKAGEAEFGHDGIAASDGGRALDLGRIRGRIGGPLGRVGSRAGALDGVGSTGQDEAKGSTGRCQERRSWRGQERRRGDEPRPSARGERG
ncbi:uncharacterized protein EHS24_009460 [Apiotrichum porosum]|uniref:Uncharacterized protein n=1 Tax=Apiotrichum porosum TaxID=105984 RepID=A0A427XLQ9_9TREE|nr:uncharacterized protein EHS24_009460 [Apiotrichum porosum]RSH79800.1 hypothetical protein EHS24_009460 [Apiotrichum porosum]